MITADARPKVQQAIVDIHAMANDDEVFDSIINRYTHVDELGGSEEIIVHDAEGLFAFLALATDLVMKTLPELLRDMVTSLLSTSTEFDWESLYGLMVADYLERALDNPDDFIEQWRSAFEDDVMSLACMVCMAVPVVDMLQIVLRRVDAATAQSMAATASQQMADLDW